MPDDVFLTSSNVYRVIPGEPVELSIVTGDAQISGTALLLDGEPHDFNNPEGPQEIGGGRDLVGSILNIMTSVRDINPATNRTSVTYILRGGVEDKPFPFAVEVTAEKGAARYLITFFFTF